jgi:NDP-sugar pyrophosphorylase family protein
MKAMVFAAGVGSRLKELTQKRPKCLMEVGGLTLLEHVIAKLKGAGVTSLMINVHHHHQQVIDFTASKNNFGIDISFSYEDSLLDTGGGLKKVAAFFKGESAFFIHNSDIFSDIDLLQLLTQHRTSRAAATLAVMKRDSHRGLYFDESGQLRGWTEEKDSPATERLGELLAFSGVSVASDKIFDYFPEGEVFSLIQPYLNVARSLLLVRAFRVDGVPWTDIGTPESLAALQKRLGC